MGRHPDLIESVPSLIDGGRKSMSRASVFDKFFGDMRPHLQELGVLDDPERIYNLDESWTGSKDEGKRQKVVVPKDLHKPYLLKFTTNDHITITQCACANGTLLPPMITFAKSIPQGDQFLKSGPDKALYNMTESGHIDSDLYLQYIRHIEPMLSPTRPVVLFQDNLYAHESVELVEFCIEKQIHLINFPSKITHIIQPMDKLFGPTVQGSPRDPGKGGKLDGFFNQPG